MARAKYVPAVGPKLRWLLAIVLGLVALLGVNSVYLAAITWMEWKSGRAPGSLQNYFYLWMFLLHLALGLALVVPLVVFGVVHIANARNRPNRRAIRAGYATFVAALGVLLTGIALTRVDVAGLTVQLKHPDTRAVVYWLHVLLPLGAAWLFVLHRLAGRRIRWKVGLAWAGVAGAFAAAMAALHAMDPRDPRPGPVTGARYFEPSLARTATGGFIPAHVLDNSDFCLECHADVHAQWRNSVHAVSSFNNPLYAFSVRESRRHAKAHDGSVQDTRFCAGCHDPVPFFSGAFEDPRWDDPEYDAAADPLGKASITCTVCHGIVAVNGVRGNADYTIGEPEPYPLDSSDTGFLRWVNRQLIKAKPAFHKRTYLKPEVHRSPEFCSTCHKVFLPEDLNDYRWLRGQDHYGSWRLSGVSGRGIVSWYYPPAPQENCNGCHMQPVPSGDFGAKQYAADGPLSVRDHMFPSANTAIPVLTGMPDAAKVVAAHEAFNKGAMRLDLFGLHEDGRIDGALSAPLRPALPALQPGKRYLLDAVVRTLKLGHEFTQGTADSNEVWLDVTVEADGRPVGRLGGMNDAGAVDPWSRFFNVFMLDREGNRIERRNPQDIFVPLYNNQVPPGAGDVTHLAFTVPADASREVVVKAALRYRKFDHTYMKAVYGPGTINALPVMTLATDEIRFPVGSAAAAAAAESTRPPEWERWYDYGIGLFRTSEKPGAKAEYRQAEHAFQQVERLGRGEGPLGLARVYLAEGRVPEAVAALQRAAAANPPAYPWSVAWFSGLANRQVGQLDAAIANFEQVIQSAFPLAMERRFNFGLDDRVLVELADTLIERARQEEESAQGGARSRAMLQRAVELCASALAMDPERPATWYVRSRAEQALGDDAAAAVSLANHARYKLDDNARDRAVTAARLRYPAANHAAEAIVIYDLQRPGAYGLPGASLVRESTDGK